MLIRHCRTSPSFQGYFEVVHNDTKYKIEGETTCLEYSFMFPARIENFGKVTIIFNADHSIA